MEFPGIRAQMGPNFWQLSGQHLDSDKNERGTGEKGQERDTRQVALRRQGGNLNF
jgi:hypothetical protein